MKPKMEGNMRRYTFICIIGFLLCLCSVLMKNDIAFAAVDIGIVNTDELNIRTGPATAFANVMHEKTGIKLNKGAIVDILDKYPGDWYKVSLTYSGKKYTGYAASMYITKEKKGAYLVNYVGNEAVMISKQKVLAGFKKKSGYLISGEKTVKVKKGKGVTIDSVKVVSGKCIYGVRFVYKGQTLRGYLDSAYVELKPGNTPAKVTAKVKISKKPGSKKYVKAGKKTVKLKKDSSITIKKEKTVKGVKWFNIRVVEGEKKVKGWISANKAVFISNPQKYETEKPKPDDNKVILSDEEFETEMTNQGFPESYKPYLRKLHKKYPYWQFKTYNTGLDWNTAVTEESTIGRSLIPDSYKHAWKSHENGAYDWKNDAYVAFDGKTWVAASKEAVAYYMDPRNFLTEKYIFMFEALNYEPGYQNAAGVDIILANTMFANAEYTYTDENGKEVTTTYTDTFMKAAELTGASPYHLASRMKQEVVTGPQSVSNSVTGTVKNFEGIYNFYNIGATDGADGNAVARGLSFAKSGTTYMRPWNNQYRSILGGAQYIAGNYITKGQNTVYLEKFNVTPNNTYKHQYMSNVAAAYSESAKMYEAYKSWMHTEAVVFIIPIFNNMPEKASDAPSHNLNPNNYLKKITLTGATTVMPYTVTPLFAVNADSTYTITVDPSETGVMLDAAPVNSAATVDGLGLINLTGTETSTVITVTAQNGETKQYTIKIIKG